MSDVVTRANSSNPVRNGGFIVGACPVNPKTETATVDNDGNLQRETLPYYQNPPISGVNGVTDNGVWDDRFDDTQYYST